MPQEPAPTRGHVFLSYAREDRELAGQIAAALSDRGEQVWWDGLLAPGSVWEEEIERALRQSRTVIVLWSGVSVRSSYVRAEARYAADRNMLVPAMIEPCDPPLPFGEYQTIDLSAWRAGTDTDALDQLRLALSRVRGPESAQVDVTPPPTSDSLPRWRRTSALEAVLGYWSDLFSLATGPKRFLLARWRDGDLLAGAALFFAISVFLEWVVTVPLELGSGINIWGELLSAAVFEPIRMFAVGAAVYLAWRAVGGTADATRTLGAFAYAYSLLNLVYQCGISWYIGLLRLWKRDMFDTILRAMTEGRVSDLRPLIDVNDPTWLLMLLGTALAYSPLVAVPYACWGAFRTANNVSRVKSAIAAALAMVLGAIAWFAVLSLSYLSRAPG